jgi:beta-lactamase class A
VKSLKLALGLVDITQVDSPRYAALNPDHMMYAASLPKIAILLGAYVKVARGDLHLSAALHEDMVRMIRHSDNPSANRVLNRVGRQDLIDILTSDPLRLYDIDCNGGLWVGKEYAHGNAYQRDPLHKLSHGASVYQVARFFYMLEEGGLVDAEYRDDMKEILSKPGIEHKFVVGLRDRPVDEMFRKSGTWLDYHADAALVASGGHRFIMVGLAHHPRGGKWLSSLAAPLFDLVVCPAGKTAGKTPAVVPEGAD